MTTVWKYPLTSSSGKMMIPHGVEIIRVDKDWQGVVCVWAIVDSENVSKNEDQIFIIGTGSEIPERSRYIGTFAEGPFVWHVFIQS